MNLSFSLGRRALPVMVIGGLAVLGATFLRSASRQLESHAAAVPSPATHAPTEDAVDLSPSQLSALKLEPVRTYRFPTEREAVGSIDYDEDLWVQVFPSYPGKILAALAHLGEDVQQGQPLYTIDSPDLIQAEATLIGAAATLELTSKELSRARDLFGTNGISERELEQATSDQHTAEGVLQAARDAVRLFGKTETEIDHIVTRRKIDPALVVTSPLSGRVIARNAQPGLLAQPGNAPAPYEVADLATKWMVANVTESDSPLFRLGQPVQASVMAFPGRVFAGKISALGASVDPSTHRVMVRCDLQDPQGELRPGMLASFVIQVGEPADSAAIPTTGVVRNGDGTRAAWVTTDRRRFRQRIVKVGLERDGRYQVLEGLQPDELAVTDGAIFLSNLLQAPPSD